MRGAGGGLSLAARGRSRGGGGGGGGGGGRPDGGCVRVGWALGAAAATLALLSLVSLELALHRGTLRSHGAADLLLLGAGDETGSHELREMRAELARLRALLAGRGSRLRGGGRISRSGLRLGASVEAEACAECSVAMQREIERLQHPPSCRNARVMLFKGWDRGFFSCVHMLHAAFLLAVADNRTFVIGGFSRYASNLTCALSPLSMGCYFDVGPCGPDDLSADGDVTLTPGDGGKKIAAAMDAMGVRFAPLFGGRRMGHLFFFRGVFRYLFEHATPSVVRYHRARTAELAAQGLAHPYLAVHVRRGDHPAHWSSSDEIFADAVRALSIGLGLRHVYVETQSDVSFEYLVRERPELRFFRMGTHFYSPEALAAKGEVALEVSWDPSHDEGLPLLSTMLTMANASFFVGQMSSNWGRLAFELMSIVHHVPPYYDVEGEWWFGGSNADPTTEVHLRQCKWSESRSRRFKEAKGLLHPAPPAADKEDRAAADADEDT